MTRYAYPTSAMYGDYLRAAAGFVPTAAILVIMPIGVVAATVLSGFAALFAVFGVRTILRHGTRFEMTKSALRASGLRRASITWGKLDRMTLAYYSTRRDRRDGWMQLELRSGRTKVKLDSRIEGFAELVDKSARTAHSCGLTLNATTLANLAALGVSLHTEPRIPHVGGHPV
ncbi:MAG: hypothetical protein JO282_07505 [Alphaproteobacteria bacterium]|nr:hypothetical protein [Alphaproteobacteria bacterium]